MNGMEQFGNVVKVLLDIGLLAFLFYQTYVLLVRTNGKQVIWAGVILALLYVAANLLNITTLLWILKSISSSLLIGFFIVFQPELRKVFLKMGQGFGKKAKHTYIDSVLIAAEILSRQKRGMLAVFIRQTELKNIIETGTRLNADLSSSILVTIFGHDTPLHDGAAIIQGGKIVAAGCFLPLSEQYDIKKTFGTRHRAALGISEETDALVLVVSEESGAISLAYDSKLHYNLSAEQLSKTLERELDLAPDMPTQEDDAHAAENDY